MDLYYDSYPTVTEGGAVPKFKVNHQEHILFRKSKQIGIVVRQLT